MLSIEFKSCLLNPLLLSNLTGSSQYLAMPSPTLDVDMRRFAAIARVKEKSVGPYPQYGRHDAFAGSDKTADGPEHRPLTTLPSPLFLRLFLLLHEHRRSGLAVHFGFAVAFLGAGLFALGRLAILAAAVGREHLTQERRDRRKRDRMAGRDCIA